eukprot:TRINITY_DN8064_c0_g1_i1.p1 TRINITY_DN8064_c0_g1~~TRINITY_DN8064_c0_g1_i1.p1  ORF type:complete len:294 (-),score=38.80 TRINITY_DN8064_c0_g1_i1:32-913(-)
MNTVMERAIIDVDSLEESRRANNYPSVIDLTMQEVLRERYHLDPNTTQVFGQTQEINTTSVAPQSFVTPERTSKRVMYLMRGAAGSGKSTLAKKILEVDHANSSYGGCVLSTDDYFIRATSPGGPEIYNFDPRDLGKAHQWNQNRALICCQQGFSPVIIDNTNTMKWEAKQYVTIALHHGYDIEIREPETTWWKSRDIAYMAANNAHQVPADSIKSMLDRWEHDFTVDSILFAERPPFRRGPPSNLSGERPGPDRNYPERPTNSYGQAPRYGGPSYQPNGGANYPQRGSPSYQ